MISRESRAAMLIVGSEGRTKFEGAAKIMMGAAGVVLRWSHRPALRAYFPQPSGREALLLTG